MTIQAAFWLGAIGGAIFGAILCAWIAGNLPSLIRSLLEGIRDIIGYFVLFFTKERRNEREIKRLQRRLNDIEWLTAEKRRIAEQESKITELKQQLGDKAFSKPEEFLKTQE